MTWIRIKSKPASRLWSGQYCSCLILFQLGLSDLLNLSTSRSVTKRCKDRQFFVDSAAHHAQISLSCLNLMKRKLRKNICSLDDYVFLSEVTDLATCRKKNIGDSLEYACCFWTRHLLQVPGSSPSVGELQKAIDEFFTTHLLHWIEALVLTRNLGIGVYSINDVEKWFVSVSNPYALPRKVC